MAEASVKLYESTEGADYHALSPLAIGSLVLGLLSPVALFGYLLWIVPALAIAIAVLALRAIGVSGGALSGRGIALAGLALGTIFAAAAPAQVMATNYLLAEQARPIAEAWFEFLQKDEPHKAQQLMKPALQRRVLNDLLWDYYKSSKENREELEKFVSTPVARAILEYGSKCQVRFYETARVLPASDADMIELAYAVTCPDGDKKQTFFALMGIERRVMQGGKIGWRITSDRSGFVPQSLGE